MKADPLFPLQEHPILFQQEMVRAERAGRKTQTRRVAKDRRYPKGPPWLSLTPPREIAPRVWSDGKVAMRCPYGTAGDRLWVRETWTLPWHHMQPRALYRADDQGDENDTALYDGFDRWRPSIHMPRWASRTLLEVLEIRVQRLQDIDDADILAEGVTVDRVAAWTGVPWERMPTLHDAWRVLWDSINAGRGFAWGRNPWVWAVTFKRAP